MVHKGKPLAYGREKCLQHNSKDQDNYTSTTWSPVWYITEENAIAFISVKPIFHRRIRFQQDGQITNQNLALLRNLLYCIFTVINIAQDST